MELDMDTDTSMHVHVHRQVYERARRHVCRHVSGHAHTGKRLRQVCFLQRPGTRKAVLRPFSSVLFLLSVTQVACKLCVAWCAWRGVAWRDVAWRGVVWCAWHGVAWRGVAWPGVPGVTWHAVSCRGMLLC